VPAPIARRTVLVAGAAALAAGGLGAAAATSAPGGRVLRRLGITEPDTGPAGVIPGAAEGRVRLEQVESRARSRTVGLFTAVPAGHGDGAGLPLCYVLHGGTATTADYQRFGFPRFLTAAVEAGVPPFVLVGADGGRTRWLGDGPADDPQRMLREELPEWCAARGFDSTRIGAYGWSMGGFGALRMAELWERGTVRAVAALSPALSSSGDPVIADADRLDGRRTALWCGLSDTFLEPTRSLAAAIPGGPAVAAYDKGAHTRPYWNRITPDAFAFVGRALT
jgi:hypothetical protein